MTCRRSRRIDHRQRFRFVAVEGGDRFLRRHLRQQHVVGVMHDVAHRLGGRQFGGMRFRHQHHAGIAAVLVDRDHLVGRAERESLAESRQPCVRPAIVRTSARIICPTVRSRIQPTSAALRMVSPRRWKRQVAKE